MPSTGEYASRRRREEAWSRRRRAAGESTKRTLEQDVLGVHVQRGREDELPEGTGAHECLARFADILAAIFLQVTLGVESSIEARRRDDALADLDGVDLAAADGQRALRALERRGRGEDEQELVHFDIPALGVAG